jgi:serine/threonine protein kinase
MEYLPYGDLEGYLKTPLSHAEARQIAAQLLEGLGFMHNNNFAHRDLKPAVSDYYANLLDLN